VLQDGRPEPHPDELRFRVVIAKQLRSLTDAARPCRKHPDRRLAHAVELGCLFEELGARGADSSAVLGGHGGLDGPRGSTEPVVQRHIERLQLVASSEWAGLAGGRS